MKSSLKNRKQQEEGLLNLKFSDNLWKISDNIFCCYITILDWDTGWTSPGEGNANINGNPLQYFCQGNPMDRRAWQATDHGVARVVHNFTTEQQQLYTPNLESNSLR